MDYHFIFNTIFIISLGVSSTSQVLGVFFWRFFDECVCFLLLFMVGSVHLYVEYVVYTICNMCVQTYDIRYVCAQSCIYVCRDDTCTIVSGVDKY